MIGLAAPVNEARTVRAADLHEYRALVREPLALGPTVSDQASPLHAFLHAHRALDALLAGLCPEPPTVVHLSQEVVNTRLVRPGDELSAQARVVAVRRDPRGLRLALGCTVADDAGADVSQLTAQVLLVGANFGAPGGDVPTTPAIAPAGGQALTTEFVLTSEFVRRYAEVAGDDNPVHLDDATARAAGFDGVIAHGMSVLAVVTEEIVERYAGGDPSQLRAIGVRFSAPVRPDELIVLELRPTVEEPGGVGGVGRQVAFSCRTPRGLALKGGWARCGTAGSHA